MRRRLGGAGNKRSFQHFGASRYCVVFAVSHGLLPLGLPREGARVRVFGGPNLYHSAVARRLRAGPSELSVGWIEHTSTRSISILPSAADRGAGLLPLDVMSFEIENGKCLAARRGPSQPDVPRLARAPTARRRALPRRRRRGETCARAAFDAVTVGLSTPLNARSPRGARLSSPAQLSGVRRGQH